jgi:hypothetical protein
VAGLTLEELVASTGYRRAVLEAVLLDELRRGRVALEDGRFSIRPGCLPPDVAEALRGLEPPDVFALANGNRRPRVSGRRLSDSERHNLTYAVH